MGGLEQHLLTLVKDFLTTLGYPGVFLLMAIEGFGIPIPSELTMPFAGFLTSSAGGDKFILPVAIAVGALGEITGSIVAYALGYFGGRPVLVRYGRFAMLSEPELEKAEVWFQKYGDRVVLVTRLLPAIRSFIALPAGVVRMPFWRFLLFGTLGSTVWCVALAILGHILGQHWQSISGDFRQFNIPMVIVIALLVAYAVYKRMTAGRRRSEVKSAVPLE